ncbi:triose-phosphate isomerase [uncultured Serinicoccus sp.]|uniref:triose-phosphate isomerase n=1 Tax=uncultured Serinicoccus sp. TaxID=735514 RepID=UPI002633BA9D|nr:triose-phosphate isomerase [uncultured Serinicoccus sp.]
MPTAGRPPLKAPFFEIGPKNLLRLPEIVSVGTAAARAGRDQGVGVILTVPTALIAQVRAAVPDAYVFAQTMDADEQGVSVGRTTAESLVDAGADGVMLNHVGHPLDPLLLTRTMERAEQAGLLTMVCADTDEQAVEVARRGPTIVLYEPPALIGGAGAGERPWIRPATHQVTQAAPGVLVMHAGGVAAPRDAYDIMRSGAHGTGSTSGVLQAPSPQQAAQLFIEAAREGYEAALSAAE